MLEGERVVEVEDGEDETDKLAQSHHQSYDQGRALRRQDKHASDAHVLGDAVEENVQPQLGHTHKAKGNGF